MDYDALRLQMMWEVEDRVKQLRENYPDPKDVTPNMVYNKFKGFEKSASFTWNSLLKGDEE